jgi:DNA-binding response OmpR family regulator
MRIMVLDDDQDIRDLLQTALTSKGHEVEVFADPTEFPFLHNKKCPCESEQSCADVLIADIVMPNMEGIEFIRNLKKEGCWPLSIGNVAIMSGYLTLHYMNDLNAMGIQYFRKPFELKTLYDWLEGCQERVDKARET